MDLEWLRYYSSVLFNRGGRVIFMDHVDDLEIAESPETTETKNRYLGTTVSAAVYKACKLHAAVTERQMNVFIEDAVSLLIEYEKGGNKYVSGSSLSIQDSAGSHEAKQNRQE